MQVSCHITINGQAYASVNDMPPAVRRQYESAMQMLHENGGRPANIGTDSDVNITTRVGAGPMHHTRITTVKSTARRIVVNGIEYTRWQDVPSGARAAFQDAGVGTEAFAPSAASPFQQVNASRQSPTDQTLAGARSPSADVDDRPASLTIGWRWFSHETVWMALFFIVFGALMILSFERPRSNHSPPTILGLGIQLIFLFFAVGMAYSVLCGFFNSTKIVLTRSELVVMRGPLPCGGNIRLPLGEIRQIYVDRVFVPNTLFRSGLAQGFILPGRSERTRGWMSSLAARMSDGSVVQLLGLRTATFADSLQFKLEQKLQTLRNSPGERR